MPEIPILYPFLSGAFQFIVNANRTVYLDWQCTFFQRNRFLDGGKHKSENYAFVCKNCLL